MDYSCSIVLLSPWRRLCNMKFFMFGAFRYAERIPLSAAHLFHTFSKTIPLCSGSATL